MEKGGGPYYLLPAIEAGARGARAGGRAGPPPLARLGAPTNVPVDYVADAMVAMMHADGLDGRAFHLVSPRPQPVVEVYNALAAAAGAPRLAAVVPEAVAAPARALAGFVGGLLGRVPEVSELRD